MSAADVQATFCATLVDEWVRRGVRHAVVAPGSRSTPFAVALVSRPELAVHVVHDERAAAFVALGLGLDGAPAVLVCTSGTAAANLHPAVVEAGLSEVPMLVVTADRPPELRDVGAAQTVDQVHLFGRSVRWYHDPGVADPAAAASWRSLGRRAIAASAAGPVHLNVPFREPLLGTPAELPAVLARPGSPSPAGPTRRGDDDPGRFAELVTVERGVILAGGRSGVRADEVAALAATTGWPVLADPLSGCRGLDVAVTAFDAMLRDREFAADHRVDAVVRIGRPAASKVLGLWVAESNATVLQIGGPGVIDPDHRAAATLPPAGALALAEIAGGAGAPSGAWANDWVAASQRAERAISKLLGEHDILCEPAVARLVAEERPDDGRVVVASSMPVRDLEWFGGPSAVAHANRGANGIDGVVSTAVGVALHGRPTIALVGDIAFVHDGGALTGLPARGCDLRIVIVDNDGGGIFSFLPQASELPADRFEQLFGTPHGTDVVTLARAHGIDAASVATASELRARLSRPGPSVTRVATNRAGNVAIHAMLNGAVAAAI
jgi:2-succinyl-5-enolpyruvyl-6-hydroxy-3-cyclohexene-1-carboxylate synthase